MGSSHEVVNPFEMVQEQIDTICERINIDEGIRERLHETTFTIL